jgi:hypothetical protein
MTKYLRTAALLATNSKAVLYNNTYQMYSKIVFCFNQQLQLYITQVHLATLLALHIIQYIHRILQI